MLSQLIEDGAKAASSSVWPLPDTEVVACLQAAHHWEQIAIAWKLRLAHEAATRDLAVKHGHRTTTAWLREALLLDPAQARELSERASAMAAHPDLVTAMIEGTVDARQAAVIAASVDAIPGTLAEAAYSVPGTLTEPSSAGTSATDSATDEAAQDLSKPAWTASTTPQPPSAAAADSDVGMGRSAADIAAEAESVLVARAAEFPAYLLRRLGDRILAHVAPEVAERADERALQRQEARARRTRTLTLSQPYEGRVRVSGIVGVEDAAIISAALQPLCTPVEGDIRTPGQRRADALVDICRLAMRTTDLPEHGGESSQLTVTVPFDPLAARLRIGTLDSAQRVSAATVRRLACDARIVPAVLGGAGDVLDVGRSRRRPTAAIRRALSLRDRGCAFPGCDRPPRWCDAHHLRPWSAGGTTALPNLVLLCRHHHTTIHDPRSGWQVRPGRDQLPDFIPPPWTDPAQHPRRNEYHLRI